MVAMKQIAPDSEVICRQREQGSQDSSELDLFIGHDARLQVVFQGSHHQAHRNLMRTTDANRDMSQSKGKAFTNLDPILIGLPLASSS